MAIDTTSPRTRRAILLGALGATAASVAAAVGRASPASAANDDPMLVGNDHSATVPTEIHAVGAVAFHGSSDILYGVQGESVSSIGVYGSSTTDPGVQGQSTTGVGVLGSSLGASYASVLGWGFGDGTAVQGHSGSTNPLSPPAKTGVHGSADQDATSVGVQGQSSNGTGGLFKSPAGIALRATGRVKFDKAAGVATIAAGASNITVLPGTDLSATSAVVATLQGVSNGPALVKSVAVDAVTNKFTIYLTANATHATKVAWHVFG